MRVCMQKSELLKSDPLDAQDACLSRRTEILLTFIKKDCKSYNVCSLNPWICKAGKFPVGHQEIFIGSGFEAIKINNDVSRIIEILPLLDLCFLIFLVRKHEEVLFSMCRTYCEQSLQRDCPHLRASECSFIGTRIVLEWCIAFQYGYKILNIFEIWHCELTRFNPVSPTGGLFQDNINEFFKPLSACQQLFVRLGDEGAKRQVHLANKEKGVVRGFGR